MTTFAIIVAVSKQTLTRFGQRSQSLLRDPRFLIGVALIVISALIGAWAVESGTRGYNLYEATRPLPLGTELHEGDVRVVSAHPATPSAYVRAQKGQLEGVLIRSVGPGELLPVSAISHDPPHTARVVIHSERPLPRGVSVGDRVDVWALQKGNVHTHEAASSSVITRRAVVVGIAEPHAGLTIRNGVSVDVTLDIKQLPTVMDAIAGEIPLMLVPAIGGE